MIPKQAHGSVNIGRQTSSTKLIMEKTMELYRQIVNPELLVRRMYVVANHVIPERDVKEESMQYSLFNNVEELERQREREKVDLEREQSLQKTMLSIKDKYGKNAILKGMNFQDGATTIERNGQVSGHKA